MNKVILVGTAGKDPELKMTTAGQPLARFSLATSEKWKDAQGNKKEKTEWHNIVIWGKLAEVAEKYVKKGMKLMLEGKIEYQEYTDSNGVKKHSTSIRCENMEMLSRVEGGEEQKAPSPSKSAPTPNNNEYPMDVPF